MFTEKDCNNIATWQIDSRKKFLSEIHKDSDKVLTMILDMHTIYTKYINPANNADKQCNQIQTISLGLEQKLNISNNERNELIILLKVQIVNSNRYEKMIDLLQNSLPAKKDQPQQSIKRNTPAQQSSTFVYGLFPSLNDQRLITRMPQSSKIGSIIGKFTKALLDPPLFTDGKDLSIDQWLSKIQAKFEINQDYYSSEKSKLIYAENRVGGKFLQHLEPCLQLNFITPFTTINDVLNYLENIFGNPHQKKYVIEKFSIIKNGI